MSEAALVQLVLLPIGLGLLGFIEPCSMGTNLLFVKHVEDRSAVAKLAAAGVFTLTRALVIGALGALAALIGIVFIGVQKAFWLLLGALYVGLGALYLAGKAGFLMRRLGPSLTRLSGVRGTAGMGLLFGLNIPACAAPLLFALFGTAAAGGGRVLDGFLALALFGIALSLPLLVFLLVPAARRGLDRLAALAVRAPTWTGVVFVALGLWSVYFGLFVRLEDWV